MIVLEFYQLAFCVTAGGVIIGHAAFTAVLFIVVAVVHRGQFAHAIVHVYGYAAGYSQVYKSQYGDQKLFQQSKSRN